MAEEEDAGAVMLARQADLHDVADAVTAGDALGRSADPFERCLRGVHAAVHRRRIVGRALDLDPSAEAGEDRFRVEIRVGHRASGLACGRSEEHTSELQSLMRISYAVFCLKTKKQNNIQSRTHR